MSAARKSDLVDIEVQKKHETRDAYLITADGQNNVWVPKSAVELVQNYADKCWMLTIPEWLATEKGLV